MKMRRLGPDLQVPAIGLGMGGMSGTYGPADDTLSVTTIHAALDAGITLLDTADFYGMGHNEMLAGRALHGGRREQAVLSVKFGALRGPDDRFLGIDNRPAAARTALAYSLQRLGTDYVDIYRPARLDPAVPIEDTVGALADLVQAGYVRAIGLSEVGPETIRRAHAVHPIADLQIEYSLFSRGIEDGILDTCRDLGIGITAYGVLAHGLLTGSYQPGLDNIPGHLPWFHAGNLEVNLGLVEQLRPLAAARGITVAELAVAWVLAQGRAQHDIVALVGARRPERLITAAAAAGLDLGDDELDAIDRVVPREAVAGGRYLPALLALLDSER